MALKKCKECNHEVSKKAKVCPNCGAPQGPKHVSLNSLLMWGLLGWFLWAIFTADFSPSTTRSSTTPVASAPTPSAPGPVNQMSDLLRAKPPAERGSILADVLHQSGKGCGSATRTFYQGIDRDSAAYWNVACSNGESYNVQIPADPAKNTRILECALMRTVGVECFKPLEG